MSKLEASTTRKKKLMSVPIGALSGRQLATQLNMTLSSTYRWINKEWIKADRLPNGRYIILPEEVQRVAQLRRGGNLTTPKKQNQG